MDYPTDYPIDDEETGREPGYPAGAILPSPLYTAPLLPPKKGTRAQDKLASLFEVPGADDNDMYVDDLLAVPEEENLDDLLTVQRSDITGYLEDDIPISERQPHWSDEDIALHEQAMREQAVRQTRSAAPLRAVRVPPSAPGSQLGGTR